MRSTLWATVISTALLAPPHTLLAQVFPAKPVRFVVPFFAGGSTDATARIIAPLLTDRWKQQVLVDPRPGAATVIGSDFVAKSQADGHTILLTTTQYTFAPATFARLPYDPHVDLVPVTLVAMSPLAIVAHPSLPVKNAKELIALARARPGELNIGTTGGVLPVHYFNMLAKVKIEIVPYKGAGPLVIDLMGGHMPLGIATVTSVQAAVRSGRARMLGVSSLKPSATFPDAPVIANDVPGFEVVIWFGVFAPRGTPTNAITRIRNDVAAALQNQNVKQRLLEIGSEPTEETHEEFTKRVRLEIARWHKVALAARIKPQ